MGWVFLFLFFLSFLFLSFFSFLNSIYCRALKKKKMCVVSLQPPFLHRCCVTPLPGLLDAVFSKNKKYDKIRHTTDQGGQGEEVFCEEKITVRWRTEGKGSGWKEEGTAKGLKC